MQFGWKLLLWLIDCTEFFLLSSEFLFFWPFYEEPLCFLFSFPFVSHHWRTQAPSKSQNLCLLPPLWGCFALQWCCWPLFIVSPWGCLLCLHYTLYINGIQRLQSWEEVRQDASYNPCYHVYHVGYMHTLEKRVGVLVYSSMAENLPIICQTLGLMHRTTKEWKKGKERKK